MSPKKHDNPADEPDAIDRDTKRPSDPKGKGVGQPDRIDELDTLDEVKRAKSVEDPIKPNEDDGVAKGVEPKGKDLERLEKREDELDPAPEPVNHPAIGNYDPRDNAKNANPSDVDATGESHRNEDGTGDSFD